MVVMSSSSQSWHYARMQLSVLMYQCLWLITLHLIERFKDFKRHRPWQGLLPNLGMRPT